MLVMTFKSQINCYPKVLAERKKFYFATQMDVIKEHAMLSCDVVCWWLDTKWFQPSPTTYQMDKACGQ